MRFWLLLFSTESVDYHKSSLVMSYSKPAEVCLNVSIIDDAIVEPTESFAVEFVIESCSDGAQKSKLVLGYCTVNVFVMDDDSLQGDDTRTHMHTRTHARTHSRKH